MVSCHVFRRFIDSRSKVNVIEVEATSSYRQINSDR